MKHQCDILYPRISLLLLSISKSQTIPYSETSRTILGSTKQIQLFSEELFHSSNLKRVIWLMWLVKEGDFFSFF